jgi:hypothetical protein
MVRFGHSYRLVQMSRACDAHSSPRRNSGPDELICGLDVKRAAMAQTERTRTGGNVPFLRTVRWAQTQVISINTHLSFLI